ncbi:MAG: protein kinase [Anaerolineae bacterium]
MADDLTGKTIGGYAIQDVIGRGGMATVYRAHQVSMNRSVAIKVLPEQYINDDTYLQRFNQEVAIVAKLEHRSIVPVHDYGEYNGQPYIVMRYMAGGSVDDLLKDGPLELESILGIIEQIGPALDYAHGKNVLHRDLKPSNVLLDDDGGAYLTDFGIARVLGEQHPSPITTQGVVGTPSYMSPEQAQGLALDGRSDIYALGIMLFEMTTGRRPFEGDTPYGIAVMQVTTPPPSPRSLNSQLSFAVEEVIYKSLRKKREERYPNAIALAEALKRALNKPVMSMHDTQPGFQRPQQQPVTPPPPPQQFMPAPQPVYGVPQAVPVAPPSTGYIPPRRKRRSSNIWMSAAVGGIVGCGVLTVLVAIILIFVSNINNRGTPSGTTTPLATSSSGGDEDVGSAIQSPTLDPTSAAARATLLPQQGSLVDSTPDILPVGVRPTESINPAIQAIGGGLVYFDERAGNYDIYKLDFQSGVETRLTSTAEVESYPSVSPDGQSIAFQSKRDGDFDIYVMNINGSDVRQLTYNTVWDSVPSWSPDGQWIVFSSDVRNDGTFDIMAVQPDGSNLRQIFSNGERNSHARYSPDMKTLLITTGIPGNSATWEIGWLNIETQEFRRFTKNDYRDRSPSYSPDGSLVLYLTSAVGDRKASGDSAVAVMDADGNNPRFLYDGAGLEWEANYSPDGLYVSFTSGSASSGKDEIFIMRADGTNILQATTGGGQGASWIPR